MQLRIFLCLMASALLTAGLACAAEDRGAGNDVDKALSDAVWRGNLEAAKSLLAKGADVNARGANKATPLFEALGNVEMMRLLLEKGADVNVKDYMGYTPLMRACTSLINNRLETVQLLLDNGADVNLKEDGGWTPLMNACRGGYTEVVRALLRKGADTAVAKVTREGKIVNGALVGETTYEATAMTIAAREGHTDIVKLLQEAGVPRPTGDDKAMAMLPAFTEQLLGANIVRVRNPNTFSVAAGVRSGNRGCNFIVPANGVNTAHVPNGKYDIYFIYSDKPDALFQGDSFTLNNNGVEIQIVKVVNGNYGIRQVK